MFLFFLVPVSKVLPLLTCSKGIVKILYVVKQVGKQKRSKFLKELARGGTGVTLVYMHHMDALQSGSSYQNSAHIKVEDCIEVQAYNNNIAMATIQTASEPIYVVFTVQPQWVG